MRERLLALRERRAALVAQADAERAGMAELLVRADRVTAWYERAKALALRLRAHPLWVAAGVALFVALRPRKALKFAATGYSLWRGWRRLSAALERYAPARPPARRAGSY